MSLAADRGWMYDVEDTDRFLSHTFCSNLDVFLDYAFSNKAFVDYNRIKCPSATTSTLKQEMMSCFTCMKKGSPLIIQLGRHMVKQLQHFDMRVSLVIRLKVIMTVNVWWSMKWVPLMLRIQEVNQIVTQMFSELLRGVKRI
nr:transposon, En/Spm-like, transposase-associated domain protein [Tanacetum cinerariifolium]